MRRADRLFQIILMLSRGRITTAKAIAQRLEVSERTIYRDIKDLTLTGAPIDGEAGVGYRLRRGYQIPPMMFDEDELQALAFGAKVAQSWADSKLSDAADRVLSKIDAVLPQHLRHNLDSQRLSVPDFHIPKSLIDRLGQLRGCIEQMQVIDIDYTDSDGKVSKRSVWPLGLIYWGNKWTLGAWCELRADFRTFRVDRIEEFIVLSGHYPSKPGRQLADYFRNLSGPCSDSSPAIA